MHLSGSRLNLTFTCSATVLTFNLPELNLVKIFHSSLFFSLVFYILAPVLCKVFLLELLLLLSGYLALRLCLLCQFPLHLSFSPSTWLCFSVCHLFLMSLRPSRPCQFGWAWQGNGWTLYVVGLHKKTGKGLKRRIDNWEWWCDQFKMYWKKKGKAIKNLEIKQQ